MQIDPITNTVPVDLTKDELIIIFNVLVRELNEIGDFAPNVLIRLCAKIAFDLQGAYDAD